MTPGAGAAGVRRLRPDCRAGSGDLVVYLSSLFSVCYSWHRSRKRAATRADARPCRARCSSDERAREGKGARHACQWWRQCRLAADVPVGLWEATDQKGSNQPTRAGCRRVSPWRFALAVDALQGAAVWPIASGAHQCIRARASACGLHMLARALRVATTDVWSGCLAHGIGEHSHRRQCVLIRTPASWCRRSSMQQPRAAWRPRCRRSRSAWRARPAPPWRRMPCGPCWRCLARS